jgi:ribosomal protein S17E
MRHPEIDWNVVPFHDLVCEEVFEKYIHQFSSRFIGSKRISEAFILKHQNICCFDEYDSINNNLTREFMLKGFEDGLFNFTYFIRHPAVDIEYIMTFEEYEYDLSLYRELSLEFIEKYYANINWHRLSCNELLLPEVIEKYFDKFTHWALAENRALTRDLIEKYKDRLPINRICGNPNVDCDFIRKHADRFGEWDWANIQHHPRLDADFIEEWQDHMMWFHLSQNCALTRELIDKYESQLTRGVFFNENLTIEQADRLLPRFVSEFVINK